MLVLKAALLSLFSLVTLFLLTKLESNRQLAQISLLFDEGVFFRSNLTKACLDVSEFLMMARSAGYFNLSRVQCAALEHNGQISFLPRAQDRPLTPADMHLAPEQEYLPTVVVMDGQVLAVNLKSAGKDEKWLATLDKDMNLTAYPCAR